MNGQKPSLGRRMMKGALGLGLGVGAGYGAVKAAGPGRIATASSAIRKAGFTAGAKLTNRFGSRVGSKAIGLGNRAANAFGKLGRL